jgi:CBS domain-containing protein
MTQPIEIEARLPIRVRRTIDGNGEITAVMLVFCSSRGRSVPLDDCTDCDRCEQVHIDPLEEDSWLICHRSGSLPGRTEIADAGGDREPVATILSPRAVCVAPDTPLAAVRDLLLERGLTGAPVVDSAHRVVGFVSRADLLRERWPSTPTVVSQVMTPMAVTVSETSSIAEASAMMALEGVHRLPVVNNALQGKVVGVVSALDVLRWYARRCGYLRQQGGN